jgi:hypothetical protein
MSVILVALPAFARIGETEQQIEARYGKSERIDTKALLLLTKIYRVGDLRVTVSFIDGISECEYFVKRDGKLTDQEVDVLLKANSIDGKQWSLKLDRLQKMWAITEGCDSPDCVIRFAQFSALDGQLFIGSKKFLDRQKTLTAEDAKKKLKDF